MRKLFVIFSMSVALMGCGRAEREATGSALASAYTVRETVGHLTTKYSEGFEASFGGGWAGVNAYRESGVGRAATAFLSPYGKPAPVDSGFKRAAEIRELNLVTAELVNLALEPRGTWISYGQEMNSIRTRFDRALLALETGTREDVLSAAKADAHRNIESYSTRVATAIAKEAEEQGRREAEAAAAEDRRQADLMQRAQAEAAQEAAEAKRREERIQILSQQNAKRQESAAPASPPAKLGGGVFSATPKK